MLYFTTESDKVNTIYLVFRHSVQDRQMFLPFIIFD